MDYTSVLPEMKDDQPRFQEESEQLISKLRGLSKKKLSALMNLSSDLTELNAMRYQVWEANFSDDTSRPAAYAFTGEVYRGLDPMQWNESDRAFAQEHVRILSGLHGLLRPLDRIRPYRLEMGTKLPVRRKKNLYEFWQDKLTATVQAELEQSTSKLIVNLASNEYAKAVNLKALNAKVITPVFKDRKGDDLKVVMMYAKHARGEMASYIVKNRITDPEDIKGFEPYQFSLKHSTHSEWVFLR